MSQMLLRRCPTKIVSVPTAAPVAASAILPSNTSRASGAITRFFCSPIVASTSASFSSSFCCARFFSSSAASSSSTAATASSSIDTSRVSSNTRASSVNFARWLSSNGVIFNPRGDAARPLFGLKSHKVTHEWYLSAATQLNKDETIVRLPRKLLLTPTAQPIEARAAEAIALVASSIPAEMWTLKNGLRLAYEYSLASSNKESFFTPYIHLLPASYPTIPLFWSPEQISAIQYAPVQQQINMRIKLLKETLEKFHAALPETKSSITLARLGWCQSSISSRAFQLGPTSHASLPLIDMMNHSYQPTCRVVLGNTDSEQADINVLATQDIPSGSELTLNYGYHSNDNFLINYGFLLDDNMADTLLLATNTSATSLELAAEIAGETISQAAAWKQALSTQLLAPSTTQYTITRDHIDPLLIAQIRILLAAADLPNEDRNINYFTRHLGPPRHVPSASEPWTASNQDLTQLLTPAESRVLYSYLSLLQSSFPTTLQEDIEQLQKLVERIMTTSPDPKIAEAVMREELAIRLRIGKKRILAEQMKRVQKKM